VFSADPERAMDIANRIQTGTIGINGYPISIGAPFGGMKASGIGREFGPETFPATLDDIQSGIGLVHNALLLD
jgi:acyl-CoA reductase-like NAD-dependent aldehyde dehydrogenase